MSIDPQIIKFLKKNAMTTHDLSKILVDSMIVNKRRVKTKLILKDVQKILKREIRRYKNIMMCDGDVEHINEYIDDVREEENDDEYRLMLDDMAEIFNFTGMYDDFYLDIEEVIQHNVKYAMLTYMMNKYNKILKRVLLTDINIIILSYV